MPMSKFTQLITQASPAAQNGWAQINAKPRALFDAICAEWHDHAIDDKMDFLRTLEAEALLDPLLREYFDTYCVPHPLIRNSFASARLEYHLAGYELRIPNATLIAGSRFHTFYAAALARLLEDNKFVPGDHTWASLELRRLYKAIEAWLLVQ